MSNEPMENQEGQHTQFPWCEQIHGGKWAAHGDGWAMHGDTKGEALENYRKAEQRRQEILARPRKRDSTDTINDIVDLFLG